MKGIPDGEWKGCRPEECGHGIEIPDIELVVE